MMQISAATIATLLQISIIIQRHVSPDDCQPAMKIYILLHIIFEYFFLSAHYFWLADSFVVRKVIKFCSDNVD